MNPGDTRTGRTVAYLPPPGTLNEGRDVNPGDTSVAKPVEAALHRRSTKAGT